MARKQYKPEEIVAKLRQVDVLVSRGRNPPDRVSEVTYYRWRQEFGGLKTEPLWLLQGRRAPAPGGLDHQRQAGRAYLAT
jgi:putative transposase